MSTDRWFRNGVEAARRYQEKRYPAPSDAALLKTVQNVTLVVAFQVAYIQGFRSAWPQEETVYSKSG